MAQGRAGQINYGYLHLRTTWPTGYPATVTSYGYNRAGAPVTIPDGRRRVASARASPVPATPSFVP